MAAIADPNLCRCRRHEVYYNKAKIRIGLFSFILKRVEFGTETYFNAALIYSVHKAVQLFASSGYIPCVAN